jgi:hypothetical protein
MLSVLSVGFVSNNGSWWVEKTGKSQGLVAIVGIAETWRDVSECQ